MAAVLHLTLATALLLPTLVLELLEADGAVHLRKAVEASGMRPLQLLHLPLVRQLAQVLHTALVQQWVQQVVLAVVSCRPPPGAMCCVGWSMSAGT